MIRPNRNISRNDRRKIRQLLQCQNIYRARTIGKSTGKFNELRRMSFVSTLSSIERNENALVGEEDSRRTTDYPRNRRQSRAFRARAFVVVLRRSRGFEKYGRFAFADTRSAAFHSTSSVNLARGARARVTRLTPIRVHRDMS